MLKKVLHAIVPPHLRPYGAYSAWRERLLADPVIGAGPFAGMPYLSESFCSTIMPKLIGIYEQELNSTITEVMSRDWDAIVDVGTAEGYYLVGLALNLPDTQMIGYEMDPQARELCHDLARKNNVDERITLYEEATVDSLRKTLKADRTFVLMDVEGAEDYLLDPKAIPELANCTILLETHDCFVEGVSDRIRDRFAETHVVTRIDAVARTHDDIPNLSAWKEFYMRDYLYELCVERTVDQNWLYMVPKSAGNS